MFCHVRGEREKERRYASINAPLNNRTIAFMVRDEESGGEARS